MDSYLPLLIFLGASLLVVTFIALNIAKNLRRDIEKALDETAGDDEAQAEIRKKVVRALFPPRFDS